MKVKIVTLISLLLFVTGIGFAQIKKVPNPKITKPAVKPNAYTLPAGTIIHVRMVSDISSKSAKVNDTFSTTLIGPVMVRGIELLPAETQIEGRITKVVKAGKKSEPGKLQVVFEKIMLPDGVLREIAGELVSIVDKETVDNSSKQELKGESATKENVALIGGGAGIGAIIGAIAGGGSGAAVGAAVGAGVGTGTALVKKGNEAIVKANSELSIVLKEEVTLPVKDY
jgi:hypothetical protein